MGSADQGVPLLRAGGTISTIDHPREPSPLKELRKHRRKLARQAPFGRRRILGQPAQSGAPGSLAAAALSAVATALAALGLAVALTAAHPRGLGNHDHAGADAAFSRVSGRGTLASAAGASLISTLPFSPNPADRPPRKGEVPSLYADGLPCSIGCRPFGAHIGWPLAPFHHQHPIRAGLNELRTRSLHVAVDIQAPDGARVYAVQPGTALVLAPSGPNARVQVGSYIYWHITPRVQTGELVIPFKTVLGRVMTGYGHIAFSELGSGSQYVNPLRPRGTALEPYADRARPVIGRPAVAAGGQVIVAAYDPQTYVRGTTYLTPVLAPAAIGYRLYEANGTAVTPLEWAFRGTHLLPYAERWVIYAPGARAPGYACFATRSVCVPHWVYRVAGGLAPPLPDTLAPGRYRLTIYAWDWAGNTTALDTNLSMMATGWRPIGHFPAVLLRVPGSFTIHSPATVPRTNSSVTAMASPIVSQTRLSGVSLGQW